ncbi:acyl-CoA N-acyltransferase [Ampelomyces quisqualis]|uniref:Acyl-CoA N-acyltransferase n=1 Tax=Ampelomyces quisqualis TaxID=50730 RepID=A0A6A5QC88_AMPQU|nr:acyl-CoA N-acyltransferase [Ampelomyces quisqualis]
MPVRLAMPQDEPAIAAICAAAFFEEGLFGQLIHPKRHQYPDDVQIFWHARVRKFFQEPRNRVIVAALTEEGADKIIGMATWQRQGDDPGAQRITQEWTDPGPDAFTPLASTDNRAIDASKATILADSYPFFKHHWEGTTHGLPRANNWHLALCCIDPGYQKRGVGQQLVHWGLERARAENVHASVITSHSNESFYLRCGFDEIVGTCSEGEGNPLREAKVKGGEILWMWAKQEKIAHSTGKRG